MDRRLVTVRKVTTVLPILGQPDKRLVSVDGFQVPVSSTLNLKSRQLVLLFKANSFLPSSIPEFANLEPKIEWNKMTGFVVPKAAPLVVKGKALPIFDGLLLPVSDFPEISNHIKQNKGRFATDDDLLAALRGTDTFRAYLEVVEFQPAPILRSITGSSTSGPSSQDTANTTDDDGNFNVKPLPFPAPLATKGTSYTTVLESNPNTNHENQVYPILGPRPWFAQKIDMINAHDIQSLCYPRNIDKEYSITTFMVGSSMAIYFVRNDSPHASAVQRAMALPNGRMGVCSRALDLHERNTQLPHHWAVARRLDLLRKLNAANRSVVIHGVLCGIGIRDNYEGLVKHEEGGEGEGGDGGRSRGDGFEFFAYAVQMIDAPRKGGGAVGAGRMVPTGAATWNVIQNILGLKPVPVHSDNIRLGTMAESHEDLTALASGPGWFTEKRAGLVFRNIKTGRAFKVMSREYIERYGEAAIRNETQDKKTHNLQ